MIGVDVLGQGHRLWNPRVTIDAVPAGFAIGVFDTTFGDVLPALSKILATGKYPAVRSHLFWSDAHAYVPREVLKARLPLYQSLAKRNPNVKVYVSPSCEHNAPLADVRDRISMVRHLAPLCIPVNAPMKGAVMDGVITETHNPVGHPRGQYIISTDGEPAYDLDSNAYTRSHADAVICFLWGMRFNLAEAAPAGTPRIPPKNRTAIPSREYIAAVCALGFPRGAAPKPTFAGKVVPFRKPLLYKTFAEDKPGESDPRANKPLTITPSTAPYLDVVTFDGKQVARFKYFGGYPEGLHRHYSGIGSNLWGYQIAKRAKEASGSEFVWFKDKDLFYGPVHPAFREGFFQD